MLTHEELLNRRCVEGLLRVLDQIPARVAVREPIAMDDATMDLVAFWTLLRWERTFLILALEEMGFNVWSLTCSVDELLNERRAEARDPANKDAPTRQTLVSTDELDRLTRNLLDRAGREARALGHPFLGTEHLLLAILRNPGPKLAIPLARHGMTYERVEYRVRQLLGGKPFGHLPADAGPPKPRYASWDSKAVGVPRRFGMSVMFLMMTMYAVLFAAMQLFGTPPVVFAVIAILVTGVGFGQMVLFGGKYPRAASIWTGAILFPIEILGVLIWTGSLKAIAILLICPPFGALFGYLAGCLAAGAFLLIELYGKRAEAEEAADAEIVNDTEDAQTTAAPEDMTAEAE
ncbi:MAG: hypothetical protein NTW96_10760 [Planctomycetia bacterium]|nr:hypothetical protein [Planctomycetia bacterium]